MSRRDADTGRSNIKEQKRHTMQTISMKKLEYYINITQNRFKKRLITKDEGETFSQGLKDQFVKRA